MLDLRLSIGFLETRAAQMGSPVSSCSAAVCSGRRDHRWPARDRLAPVKFSLRPARGGLAPLFFAVQRRWPGTGWLIWCLAALGEARVVHAPVSGEDSALLRRLGLNFSVRCVCVSYSFYVQLLMCGSSFTRIFFVMGLIVILVKFEILHT
jgi:hypothetical protein